MRNKRGLYVDASNQTMNLAVAPFRYGVWGLSSAEEIRESRIATADVAGGREIVVPLRRLGISNGGAYP